MGDSKNLEQRTRDVFIICPVRGVSPDESLYLAECVSGLERGGDSVHYPPRDTRQDDQIGLDIVSQNRDALGNARRVKLYWNPKSQGSLFDTGMAFMAEKPLDIINHAAVVKTPDASFENFLLDYESCYSSLSRPAVINVPNDGSICIICPKDVTLREGAFLEEYISPLEIDAQQVYCPAFGARKPDSSVFEIYRGRRAAIRKAKEVHVLWSNTGRDDLFGLGMAFMAEKPIVLINRAEVPATPEKSFSNVVLALDDDYRRKRTQNS